LVSGVSVTTAADSAGSTEGSPISKEQAQEAGVQAVIYGLPLVMIDITMKIFTNTPSPRGAPVDQFIHERACPPASFKQVVRMNIDALYSSAFLDLSKEPQVMSVPDADGR
jgi:hypothetical protein